MNRPVVWAAGALAAGIYVAGQAWLPRMAIPGALVAGAASVFLFGRRFSYRDQNLVAWIFFAAGALAWLLRPYDPSGDALSRYSLSHPETQFVLEGRVREAPVQFEGERYVRFLLDIDRALAGPAQIAAAGGVLVRWRDPGFWVYSGDRIQITGVLGHYLGPVNHGVAGFEDYLRTRGIHSEIQTSDGKVKKQGSAWWSPRYWASRLRQWEGRTLRTVVPESSFPFVLAVWLGDRGQYSQRESQRFINTGTAHILAVSGLHVGIIYASVAALLQLLRTPRRIRAALTILAVFLFALAAGARASSLRAAMMIALYLSYELTDREPDALTALSLSALILLTFNAGQLFNSSFVLSFGSVASILFFAEPIGSMFKWMPWWLRKGWGTVLGVQLLTFPFALHYFHVAPLLSPLANLVIVPLLSVVLWVCFLTTLLAAASSGVAMIFGYALGALVHAIRLIADLAAAIPYGHLVVVSPTVLGMIAFWMATGALYGAFTKPAQRRWWAMAAAACLGVAWMVWRPWHPAPVVDFLDVGHADAAFVRTPGGTTFLIDGGLRSDSYDCGERVVLPFLYSNGIGKLDYVVATHSDSDHMGGLITVLERMPVKTAVLGPLESGKSLEKEFLRVCKKRGVPVLRVGAGSRIPVEGAELEVLHPPPDVVFNEPNESSVVLRFLWPGLSVLFSGDIEDSGEGLLTRTNCQAAVLKAPHHGSDTSSSSAFLDTVRPAMAVISTAPTKSWEAVPEMVLARYRERNIAIWRTDYHGGIRLFEKGGAWFAGGARLRRGYSLEPVPAAANEMDSTR